MSKHKFLKMKSRFLMFTVLAMAFVACNKNDDATPVIKPKDPNYFPLSIGSYWVYNTYKIDSLGNEELYSQNDTTRIIGDTMINKNTYKIYSGHLYSSTSVYKIYYRDSSRYIISDEGNIIFSSDNFTDTITSELIPNTGNPQWHLYSKMDMHNSITTLEAGTFDSLLIRNLYIEYLMENPCITRSLTSLYAPNVGKIVEQIAFIGELLNTKCYYEKRLVSYYIKK